MRNVLRPSARLAAPVLFIGLSAILAIVPLPSLPSAAAGSAGSGAFGRETAGSVWRAMGADYKRSSRFELGETGAVTDLVAHLDGGGGAAGSQQVRFAVYADQSGRPGSLLAQSEVGTVSAGSSAAWLRLPLSSPLDLAPGSYHLAILSGASAGVARYSREPSPAGLLSVADTFGDGASPTYGSGTPDDFQIAIHALYTTGSDVEPPTAPSELRVTAAEKSSVSVAWSASTDNVGVAGYRTARDGTPVGATEGLTTTFGSLTCGTRYTFSVEAYDAAGNTSPQSSITASTSACAPTSSNTLGRTVQGSAWLSMGADYKRSSRFELAQAAVVSDLVGHLDGLGGTVGTQEVRFAIYGDAAGEPGLLLARSEVGTVTAGSPAAWKALPLTSPLVLPPGAYHLAIHSGGTGRVARYSRDPAPNGLVSARDTFADGPALTYGTGTADNFEVAIHALYEPAGGEPLPDIQAPTAPTNVVATPDSTSVGLSWSESTDNVGVAGYRVYRDGSVVGTTAATSSTVGSLACGTSYGFAVEAFDATGNVSPRSSVTATTSACPTSDTEAPSAPSSFGASASATSASLLWMASTDNVGVAGYRVYRDGSVVGTTAATFFSVGSLSCATSYAFAVEAFDAARNVSARPSLTLTTSPCPPLGAGGCDRFASPTGSDVSAGTESAPFRSAQKLLTSLAAGQVGCLRAGVYSSSSTYVLDVSRDDATLQSYPGERATLLGNVIVRPEAERMRLASLDFEGTGGSNTIKVYGTDFVLERSDVTNVYRGRSCMILGSTTTGTAVRPIIRQNRFHECGAVANGNKDHGIYAAVTAGGEIVGNLFYNHIARAVQIYPHAKNLLVAHNVIDGGAPSIRGGIVIGAESSDPSSGNVVEYNVIAYAETYNVYTNWNGTAGSGNIVRHNCVWAGKLDNFNLDQVAFLGNLVAEPLFLDRAKRDYRLNPASPCLAVIGHDPVRALD